MELVDKLSIVISILHGNLTDFKKYKNAIVKHIKEVK